MLEKLGRGIENIADDLGYFLKRSSAFMLGKAGGQMAGEGVALGLIALIGAGGSATALPLGAIIGTALAVAAVAGISATLVQSDFRHRRHLLVNRYRDEAGAILQKAPDKIVEQDIEILARGDFKRGIQANPAIRQELKNSWLERNVGMVLSAVVAAATYFFIHEVNPASFLIPEAGKIAHDVGGYLMGAIGDTPKLLNIAGVLSFNGLAGFGTYHAIKTPLHMLASEVLGIEENTVNDRITDIKRGLGHGHTIQPEQVLGVFIQAHQDVTEQMKADYGKGYDQMNTVERGQILAMMQQYMDIKSITDDINSGRMRPEELAFTTFGQKSGLEKAEEGTHKHQGNIFDGMWKGLSAITGGFTSTARPTTHKEMTNYVGEMPGQTTYSISTPNANEASMQLDHQFEETGRKQSFVARVGRKLEDDGISHVERLSQSSNQELVLNR